MGGSRGSFVPPCALNTFATSHLFGCYLRSLLHRGRYMSNGEATSLISTISFAPSPSFVVELAVPKAACVGDVSPDVGPPRLIADLALTQFDLIYIGKSLSTM